MQTEIAICVIAYKRPDLLQLSLESLSHCYGIENFPVYLFVDGAKTDSEASAIEETEKVARTFSSGLSNVVQAAEKNKGLAASVIGAVDQCLSDHKSVIVLEDDLLLSPPTLDYFLEAFSFMEKRDDIMTVSAYQYPNSSVDYNLRPNEKILVLKRAHSWGWGITKKHWETLQWSEATMVEWLSDPLFYENFLSAGPDLPGMLNAFIDGNIKSWAIRMAANQVRQEKYTLYPHSSLIANIGFDDRATHTKSKMSQRYNGPDLQLNIEPYKQNDFYEAVFRQSHQSALNLFFIPDSEKTLLLHFKEKFKSKAPRAYFYFMRFIRLFQLRTSRYLSQ